MTELAGPSTGGGEGLGFGSVPVYALYVLGAVDEGESEVAEAGEEDESLLPEDEHETKRETTERAKPVSNRWRPGKLIII